MYKIIFFIASVLLLASCKKEFTIKLPEEPAKPVLSAFMNQDSIIVARVTLSGRGNYFGGPVNAVSPDNAVLKLYEDGAFVETLRDTIISDGFNEKKFYKSHARVSKGKTYKLTLEVPGCAMVEGSNLVPDRGQLEVSGKSVFLTPTEYDYENTNFRFTITNKGAEKCYYRFRMLADSSYYVDPNTNDTVYDNYRASIALKTQENGLSIFGDSYIDPVIGGIYSVKALNPGESRIITLTAENVSYYNGRFVLEVSLLTDDSYNYLFSLNNVLKNEDDPTAEKQNVICNVKNGFGIVGGMALQEAVFRP